jgi:hypothetical protein
LVKHVESGILVFVFLLNLHDVRNGRHLVVDLKCDANRCTDLIRIVDTHTNEVSHFFKLQAVIFSYVADYTHFVRFVDELEDSVGLLTVFSEDGPYHEVFGVCG